jgi:lipoprotein-releasing system ATP-binding protein
MIEASGITKTYGELQVLKGVDVTINRGEVVSIVGASGAGKSTLLHIIGTLDRADQGQLKFENRDLTKMSSDQLALFRNQNIGFIFQFHNLLPEFTALENVCIPAFIGGQSQQQAEKRAKELLAFLKLEARIDHKPGQLSGGEQQRVAVARALMNNPSVVLADEPSGNLDSNNARDLHKLFFDLREKFNQTFIIVTHNEELARMADRTLVMKDGRL